MSVSLFRSFQGISRFACEAKDAPGCYDVVLVTIDPGVGSMS